MSFLTTTTEEMLAAEALLSGINSNLAAQNAGAASATTAIAPAAADPVSAQQAAIFSAYGTQYQAIASEAQTLLEQYSQTLGISSNSYGDTEAVNASQTAMQALSAADPTASAATGSNPIDILAWLLGFNGQSSGGLGGMFGLSSNGANIGNIGIGNWASATSNLLGLAGGGLLDTSGADAAAGADLATSTAPVETGVGGAGVGGVAGMCDAGRRDGPGDHRQQTVRAAELGRRHPGGRFQQRAAANGGLDRRRSAGRRRHGGAGHARGGDHGAQQRRFRGATLRRQTDRHAQAGDGLGNPGNSFQPIRGAGYTKWFLTLRRFHRKSPRRSCTPARARAR